MRTDPAVNSAQPFYYQQDHEGSVTHLTNSTGTVIEKYRYDVFGLPTYMDGSGTVIGGSAYTNRFLFTGREYNATFGFYEYRARAYHPGLGRFMSEDPKLFDAGDYNLFRYVHNDPLDLTDPMGLWNPQGSGSPTVETMTYAAEHMNLTIAERISLWQKSMESSIGGERAYHMANVDRQLAKNSRSLTAGEIRLAKPKFGNAINYRDTAIVHGSYIPFGRTMSPNGKMYYPGIDYSADYSKEGVGLQSKFIHEMTHVWQFQTGRSTLSLGLAHIFHGQYKYIPVKNPARPFQSYGIEQQAMIMQDYFMLERGYPTNDQPQPNLEWYQAITPFGH